MIDWNPYQYYFINEDWQNKRVAFYGEFRCGKTTAAGKLIHILTTAWPRSNGLVLRNFRGDLTRTTIPQLMDVFPFDILDGYNFNKSENILHTSKRGMIYFMGLDKPQDKSKLKNMSLGWVFIDQAEEISEEIFLMAEGRLTTAPNTMILTGNTEGKQWDYETFFLNDLMVEKGAYAPNTPKGADEIEPRELKRGVFFGKDERHIGILPPPFLNQDNIVENYYYNLISTRSTEWSDKYVWCIFGGHAGLILSDYDEKRNNITEAGEIREGIEIRFDAMDYGTTNPTVWLILYYSRDDDTIYFIDEYYVGGHSVQWHAPKIKTFYSQYGAPRLTVGCPRTFQTESDSEKPSDIYEALGINIQSYPIGFETAVEIANGRLKTGRIKILSKRCVHLKRQIESITWKNYKNAEDHALEPFLRIVAKLDRAVRIKNTLQSHKDSLSSANRRRPSRTTIKNMEF